jgi:hypothetical protein
MFGDLFRFVKYFQNPISLTEISNTDQKGKPHIAFSFSQHSHYAQCDSTFTSW